MKQLSVDTNLKQNAKISITDVMFTPIKRKRSAQFQAIFYKIIYFACTFLFSEHVRYNLKFLLSHIFKNRLYSLF